MNARGWNGEPGAADDPGRLGRPAPAPRYVCVSCQWRGGGASALEHHVNTGHGVRGASWPEAWPNAVFTGGQR